MCVQFITIYVNEYRCIDDHVASATKVQIPNPKPQTTNPKPWALHACAFSYRVTLEQVYGMLSITRYT